MTGARIAPALRAFVLEITGKYSEDQATRRGVATWSKPRTVVAKTEDAAVARARVLEPEAEFVVVKESRPARWSELPLEAFEAWHTSKAAATASAAGWKRRSYLARVFPRTVRAGGAESDTLFCVVVRRQS